MQLLGTSYLTIKIFYHTQKCRVVIPEYLFHVRLRPIKVPDPTPIILSSGAKQPLFLGGS